MFGLFYNSSKLGSKIDVMFFFFGIGDDLSLMLVLFCDLKLQKELGLNNTL